MSEHAFVIGLMQFRIRKPTSGSFITCLDVMAQQQGISVAAAGSLIELEDAGLLRWRIDEQVAELAERPDQFSGA